MLLSALSSTSKLNIATVIRGPAYHPNSNMNAILSPFTSSFFEAPSNHPRRAIGQTGFVPEPSRFNGRARIETFGYRAAVLAYPSQGGFVALEDATGVDFEFLGLDPINPPRLRLRDQNDENEFAKRLLLLGAKWWSSDERFRLFQRTYPEMMSGWPSGQPEEGLMPPTVRERRWTVVGWPSSGGLWVAEFEINWEIVQQYIDDGQEPPAPMFDPDIALVKVARTMDERCQILKERFKAKFYSDISEYKGPELLNSFTERGEAAGDSGENSRGH